MHALSTPPKPTRYFVGLDVHRDTIAAHVYDSVARRPCYETEFCAQTPIKLTRFVDLVRRRFGGFRACYEASFVSDPSPHRLDRPPWHAQQMWGALEARMATPQNRVARILADEDGTDGYFVVNVRGGTTLGPGIDLSIGIDNLFDIHYHEHLSFGNLPNPGRNFCLALSYSIQVALPLLLIHAVNCVFIFTGLGGT